jgi:hypothetical protein
MKILSVGFPLPGRGFDNHNFINAPAFFDYDALVVDPVAVSRTIEEVAGGAVDYRTGDDQPVANLSSSPLVVGLDRLLTSRRQQTELLLRRGGIVVVVAAPDVAHSQVAGLSAYRRYSWLPAPEGYDWSSTIAPAFGKGCRPSSLDHPFAAFADYARERVSYQAFFPEGAPGLEVFARSRGGAAVGVALRSDRGQIVFLPALGDPGTGAARAQLATLISQCIANLSELRAEAEEPAWAAAQPLPGLEQLEAAEEEARLAEVEASGALQAAVAAREAVTDLRRLLWADGPVFRDCVVAALRRLGFKLIEDDQGGVAIVEDERLTFVECESSAEEVGMDPHYRLRQRREEALARGGAMPGGMLVVNGYRDDDPSQRGKEYSDGLRIAAESQRYCLSTATTLFKVVAYALAAPSDLAPVRRPILEAEGLFDDSLVPTRVVGSNVAGESTPTVEQ